MSYNSAIEWTDATWNPVRARYTEFAPDGSYKDRIGWHCTHVSEGCRLGTGLDYKPASLAEPRKPGQIGTNAGATVFLDENTLTQPLRWKKPRKIFVCSMTDLFGDFVTDEMRDRIFAVIALCPQHTFQILTKRPGAMSNYVNDISPLLRLHYEAAEDISGSTAKLFRPWGNIYSLYLDVPWPFANVWLGVSIEDQATANERVPLLLSTRADVHFVSAEPLLGPIDISKIQPHVHSKGIEVIQPLDWVIAGGESGRGARPMHPDWALSLRDQCRAAGVPFFFKQWGEWREWEHGPHTYEVEANTEYSNSLALAAHNPGWISPDGDFVLKERMLKPDVPYRLMERLGKNKTGAALHGREHREYPDAS